MSIGKTELTIKIEEFMADLTEEVLIHHKRLLFNDESDALCNLRFLCEKLLRITEAEAEYDEILAIWAQCQKTES